jgi:hypothetical protein
MRYFFAVFNLILLFTAHSTTYAYEESSYSTTTNLFLARPDGGEISFSQNLDSEKMIRSCSKNEKFFVAGTNESCICVSARFGEPPIVPEGSLVIGLECPKRYRKERHAPLLTLVRSASAFKKWKPRDLSSDEQSDMSRLLQNRSIISKVRASNTSLERSRVWFLASSKVQVFLISMRSKVNELGCKSVPVLVFIRDDLKLSFIGSIDDVQEVFSLENAEQPLLKTKDECDGISVMIKSVRTGFPSKASFSGH